MDQDDSMLSTPSSNPDIDESMITNPTDDTGIEDEEMFPTTKHTDMHDRPRTPQNDHLNAAAPGELSPPRSQTNAQDRDAMMQHQDDLDMSPTNPNLGGGGASGAGNVSANGINGPQDTQWKAGYGWKNKKAQMEMHKAMDGFSDRDFSLKQFGDVLAHRIGLEAGE